MYKYLFLLLLLFSKFGFSQIEISWKDLEDIEFSEAYVEEVDQYILFPHFGLDIRELESKEVVLSGYILALDPKEDSPS